MREAMRDLHVLYQAEEKELTTLSSLAQTTHPELLVENPQLHNMASQSE